MRKSILFSIDSWNIATQRYEVEFEIYCLEQGAFALCGGDEPEQNTQTVQNTTQYQPGAQKMMDELLKQAYRVFLSPKAGVEQFPGSTVAGFDPNTTAAQNRTVQYSQGQGQSLADQAVSTGKFAMSPDILSPDSNPGLAAAIQGAINPVFDQLQESVLPGLRGSAVGAGAVGGTRQGVAEGIATGKATRNAMDISSSMQNENYQKGLDTMMKSLALAPSTFETGLAPGLAQGAVGFQNEQMAQAQLNDKVNKWNFNQTEPMLRLMDAASLAFGAPAVSATSTGVAPGPQGADPLSSMLGSALTGAQLGKTFGPTGAIIGGVGGGLFDAIF